MWILPPKIIAKFWALTGVIIWDLNINCTVIVKVIDFNLNIKRERQMKLKFATFLASACTLLQQGVEALNVNELLLNNLAQVDADLIDPS